MACMRGCLPEILEIQAELPERILFLQPFKGEAIASLREVAPYDFMSCSPQRSVRLFAISAACFFLAGWR